MDMQVNMRWAAKEDQDRLAELRAVVLYDDLNRLGRYDDVNVRERFRKTFDPEHTWIIEVDGNEAGCVALKPKGNDAYLLEHFYIDPAYQGRRIGTHVLKTLLARAEVQGRIVHLNVLQGSPARRLYERFGFAVDSEDEVDVFMSVRSSE